MKKYTAVLMSILLLTFGFSMNAEDTFAVTLMQEKENIIQDLEIIKNDPNINKKTKKNIESAIKKIEKSLNEKFWKDESTLNFKPGKKVLNAEQNAVNKLDKILKDKKESNSIKEEIVQINLRIAEVDKTLVGNAIDSLEDIIMSDKGLKKLDKAIDKFEKGNEFLEDDNYSKAIKNYIKSWDQIKKALKDPNFKKMKMVDERVGFLDNTFDNIPDVYFKIITPGKPDKPNKIQIKITGPCVNGEIHDDAVMKVGFSTQVMLSTEFFDDEITATNKWFKKNDPNKKIDLVVITTVKEYFRFPISGDDLIQKNPEDKKGSFKFISGSIPEIGGQAGWVGEFEFEGQPGDYNLTFWFPLTSPSSEGDSCNFVSSISIPATVPDKTFRQFSAS